jgi:hypothetical protein
VLIAAAISSTGAARELIVASLRREVLLSLSSLVLQETARNLARKAPAALPATVALPDEVLAVLRQRVS